MNSTLLKKIIKEEITKVMREEESKKEKSSFTSEEKEMLTDFGFHPLYGKSMTYEDTIDNGDETMEITLEVEKRDGVFFCSGSTEYGQLKDTKKSNVKSVIAWAKRTIDSYK